MDQDRIAYLISRYLDKNITEPELHELAGFLLHDDQAEPVQQAFDRIITGTAPLANYRKEQWEGLYQRIAAKREIPALPVKGIIKPLNWKRWSVAAAIIILLGFTAALIGIFSKKQDKQIVKTLQPKTDVAPGTVRAVLTLANGQKIVLDSAKTGTVAEQGKTKVQNREGQLLYDAAPKASGELFYNTLTTSRGQTYPLVLSDGTKVWLNAASSIRFPVIFTGSERRVEITGEAYFEVARNPSKPFKVEINNRAEVEVLGTHFNINAYDDETSIKTTLLEGSVKLSMVNGQWSILKPGEQAQITNKIKVINDVDMEEVMAWKNGSFAFADADLTAVMRQLARWYDVDVVYDGNIPDRQFNGKIGKTLTLDQVLKVLTTTARVHYVIEGKKLTIRP